MQKRVFAAVLLATCAREGAALELSANGGYMTTYVFRGIEQEKSSVMAGLDLKHEGFYAGTWAADVGDGLEVDLYGGYNGSLGELNWGLGATGYLYTDGFDDTYREANLSLGWKFLSVSAAFGEYDNHEGRIEEAGAPANEKLRYSFLSPRVDYRGFYGLVGSFGRDFDGEYYEAGYGGTFERMALGYRLSFIHSTDTLLGDTDGDGVPDDDDWLVLSFTKTFALAP